jgi:hypothetical protein
VPMVGCEKVVVWTHGAPRIRILWRCELNTMHALVWGVEWHARWGEGRGFSRWEVLGVHAGWLSQCGVWTHGAPPPGMHYLWESNRMYPYVLPTLYQMGEARELTVGEIQLVR